MRIKDFTKMLDEFMADGQVTRKETRLLKSWLSEQNFDWSALSTLRNLAIEYFTESIKEVSEDGDISETQVTEIISGLSNVLSTLWKHGVAVHDKTLRYKTSVHFAPRENLANVLINNLKQSKKSVDIAVYTITYNLIRNAIRHIAKNNHTQNQPVRIRILTDDDKVDAYGSDIRDLSGYRSVSVRTDGPLSLMHHKFAVIDNKILINGSFNWTRNATYHNFENMTITTDAVVVEMFLKEFESIWNKSKPLKI